MYIFNIYITGKPLTNIKLSTYVQELQIPYFRGVPRHPSNVECGIVNMNTSRESGNHWVFYYRNKSHIIYFDSYGQITPLEIQRYLKKSSEFDRGSEVIQRNTDIVQASNTSVCGHLYSF